MKIVIDCYTLVKGKGKSIGIYNYAKNILNYLVPMLSVNNEVIILCNNKNLHDFEYKSITLKIIKADPTKLVNRIMWETIVLPAYLLKLGADVYFSPKGSIPLVKVCKVCVTIHDLIPFYYHENFKSHFNRMENYYVRWRITQAVKAADQIITVSEFSKYDIIDRFKVDPDKINVIYNGVETNVKVEDVSEKDYIFAITSELPHKNLKTLLKGYEIYYNNCNNKTKLIICGVKNPDRYKIIDSRAFNNIKFVNNLSDAKLNGYYKNAKMFIFIPLIEGFGLPPLEAMRFNIPVICSNCSSLAEIYKNAAVLVNPHDPNDIARAIYAVEENIVDLESIKKEASKLVKKYTWHNAALKTSEVFDRIINNV
jgi:glycosyltransferase involved in cell wall biosynthesis